MTEAEQVMKRCQIGTRNYEEANNLHADCYRVIGKLLAEHAMREVQRLGQEIEQAPVWIDAGNLKRLKKGDVLRVFRKGQEYYSAFRFDGLLQECDYTYDGDAPFVWLEVGMATLDKIVYTKKDFTTGAVYADRGDRVELFQPALEEALAQPEQEPVSDDIASILACRNMLDAQPVPPRTWVGSGDLEDSNAYLTTPQRKPLTNGEIYTAYITATNQTLRATDERLAFAFARAIEAAHGIKENT